MNELQVINLDNTDLSTWDFSALKEELRAYLADYEGLVYTDETIKDAKKDRTTLNRAKKVVEDARKAYKARCLAPYEALEPQIKELTSLIEDRRKQIDEIVKDFENRQKEVKEKEVREYYDRISGCFGTNADRIYQKIFDPKWTNASTGAAKYRDSMQTAVGSAARDLKSIKALGSPFEDTLTELYLETLSMDAVLKKNDELKEAAGRAGLMGPAASGGEDASGGAGTSGTVREEQPRGDEEKTQSDGTEEMVIRIRAPRTRLNQVCDFMKAIGVTYEVL